MAWKVRTGSVNVFVIAVLSFSRKFVIGVPAIVDHVDTNQRRVFAHMQGHYKDCTCFFESKDLICMNFDDIDAGRQVLPASSYDVRTTLTRFCNRFLLFHPKMLNFNSPAMLALLCLALLCSRNVGFLEYYRCNLCRLVALPCRAGFESLSFCPTTLSDIV